MINAFRARSRARRHRRRAENAVDDHVLSLLSSEEIDYVCNVALPLCREYDKDDSGTIKISELKDVLKSSRVGLTPVEVNVMIQTIPRDSFGNADYNTHVYNTLKQVKFTLPKNENLESPSYDIAHHTTKP